MCKSLRILIARNRPGLEILKQSTLICWSQNQLSFTTVLLPFSLRFCCFILFPCVFIVFLVHQLGIKFLIACMCFASLCFTIRYLPYLPGLVTQGSFGSYRFSFSEGKKYNIAKLIIPN